MRYPCPHYLPDSIMSSRTMTQAYTTILCVPSRAHAHPPVQSIAGRACSSEAKPLTGKPAYPGLPCGKKGTVSFRDTLLSRVF